MRRGIAATACAALAIGATTLPAAEGNGRDRCARKGSVTLIKEPRIRVYRDRHDRLSSAVFACHRPTGRATRLGFTAAADGYQYGGTRATAIRGSVIAYGAVLGADSDEGLGSVYDVVVASLPVRGPAYTRGQRFRAVETEPFDRFADDNLAIERMLIAPNRTVAYSSCQNFNGEPDRCVRPLVDTRIVAVPFDTASDRFAKAVVLDSGPGIDPRSLRLSPSGTRLAWSRDGARRTVRVPDAQP